MFKIEFFVDDKYLAEVLRGVSGKARQLQVIPVVNVVQETDKKGKPNGKLKQDAEHTLGLFCKELKKAAPEAATSADARKALEKIGLSPTSNNHFLNQAVKAGLMKKHKKEGKVTWEWV